MSFIPVTIPVFSYLKNHPFAVEAFFDRSLVITFALPIDQLKNRIPKYLSLDAYQDKWAFVAVAMVQTRSLRPKGIPEIMGNDFFLIGYRVFVRYTTLGGKNLRGLYILKSETDKRKMQLFGNLFTHYRYTTTDICQESDDRQETIASKKSKFHCTLDLTHDTASLPDQSPFNTLEIARRYSGPLPFTFTCNEKTNSVLIIEGVRSNWKPKPVEVIDYQFDFFRQFNLESPVLASAFEVRNVPYFWKKGKLEIWP